MARAKPEEKLNIECDMLAKEAIENSLHQPTRKQKEQLLPLEPASLGVDGVKQTSNLAPAVRGAMERKDAERFYREELGWPKVTFTFIHKGVNMVKLEVHEKPSYSKWYQIGVAVQKPGVDTHQPSEKKKA